MTIKQLEYWELVFKVAAYLGGAVLFVIKIRSDTREYKLKEIEINIKIESLKTARFNYLEKLNVEFNKPLNKYALLILDDFVELGIHKSDLVTTLRDHNEREITEENELEIRDSFDNLLESCLLVLYHYEHEMITTQEIKFFSYYLNKIKNCEGVKKYIQIYYKERNLDKLFELV